MAFLAHFAPSMRLKVAGFVFSLAVAGLSAAGEKVVSDHMGVMIPAAVLALLIGIGLNGFASRSVFSAGLQFCAKTVLQVSIALLGLRIVFDDIIGLGLHTLLIVSMAMVLTILCGIALARLTGRSDAFGALAGGATAICGASAALAISTVLPEQDRSDADTAFVVLACNLLATIGMIAYPPLAILLGLTEREVGVFLGGSIHDVAQVVGAGISVSVAVASLATIVKIYRVFLLLPVVLLIGTYLRRGESRQGGQARVPVPYFAFAFLGLAALHSFGMVPETLRVVLLELARWGLLIAIGALGLKTSIGALTALGFRPVLIMLCLMMVIGVAVLLPLIALASP